MPGDNVDTKPVVQNSTIGNVPFFNPDTHVFNIFHVQLMQFFVANDIKDEKRKKAVFLTALSENAYVLLANLLNPSKPTDDSVKLDKCLSAFEAHFEPAVCAFMERRKFYKAEKQPAETVRQWAARVRALAAKCTFGTMLETAMRDKFVMALENGPAREKIFLEGVEKADFKKSLSIAIAAEYIQGQSREEQQSVGNCLHMGGKTKQRHQQHNQQQNQRHQQHNQQQQQQCFVCGNVNHKANTCRFRNYKCNNCQKRGHLRKMCKTEKCNFIEQANMKNPIEQSDMLNLFTLQGNNDGPIIINVIIDNEPFAMELDTGSQACVVPWNVFKVHFKNMNLEKTPVLLRTYAGTVMKPEGRVKLNVKYNGCCKALWFIVVKEQGPILLDRDFLNKFQVKFSAGCNKA